MQVDFQFAPLQRVKIIAFGLHYEGVVVRCEYDGHVKTYCTEYAADGKIEQRAFYEDQLL